MTIHREGRVLLLVLLVVFLGLNFAIHHFVGIPWLHYAVGATTLFFFLIVLQFFRSPIFEVKQNPSHVIAPADGKVVVIEDTVETEYFKGPRKQVSIFMSPFNVHVNRNPIGGTVKFVRYHAGKYLVAWHPKSSTENERTTIVIQSPNGTEVLFRQIAGALARRIKWYVKEGQQVAQGDEFGFIKFGSRVDIFLPVGTEVTVSIDEKVKGGRTVIAKL